MINFNMILEIFNMILRFFTNRKALNKPVHSFTASHNFLISNRLIIGAEHMIKRVVDNTRFDRFLVIMYHNDGKPIDLAQTHKISILFEAHSRDVPSIIDIYQNFEVDGNYKRMVQLLKEKRKLKLVTADIDNAIVKLAYELAGIKRSLLYDLMSARDNHIFLFASMGSRSGEDIDMFEKNEVVICLNKLRGLIREMMKDIEFD